MNERGWLSVAEAAREAGVSGDTIRRWCDQGRLVSVRTAGGHRRVSAEGLGSLLRDGGGAAVALTRETRDLAAVFDGWCDQVDGVRPFVERSFDSPAALEKALFALVGVRGDGGLVAALRGLADELAELSGPTRLRLAGPDDRPFPRRAAQ